MKLSKIFFTLAARTVALALIGGQAYANQPATSEATSASAVETESAVTTSSSSATATPAATENDNAEVYATQINVEIIAFQRLFDSDSLNQKFPELTSVIPTADALLPSASQINARSLADNEMQLNDIFTKFEQHDAYVPFYHQAWTQPLNQQIQAPPIRIQSDPANVPALDGRFMVWQDDKIELNFNLAFSYSNNQSATPSQQAFGSVEPSVVDGVPDIDAVNPEDQAAENNPATATRHTIQYQSQSSYIDNQMMYFDHPLFGILVLINSADGKPLKGVNSSNMAQ